MYHTESIYYNKRSAFRVNYIFTRFSVTCTQRRRYLLYLSTHRRLELLAFYCEFFRFPYFILAVQLNLIKYLTRAGYYVQVEFAYTARTYIKSKNAFSETTTHGAQRALYAFRIVPFTTRPGELATCYERAHNLYV